MRVIRKKKKQHIFLQFFLWVYAFISLYPLIWMVFYSLKNNDEIFVTNPYGFPVHFRIENYITAWSRYNVPVYFFNSLLVAVVTVIGTITLAVMFSYAVARMRWKLKDTARIYVMIGMFIPVQVIMIPLAILVRDFGLTNTYFALFIPYIAFNLAFSTAIFYGFFRTIPFELEESGCIDGASIYKTFFSIILPIVKPAIATVVIFIFLSSWNEFTMALILISKESLKTLPLGLLFFQGEFTTDWGAMGAAMTIASVPTILIYMLFSEQVENALTVGASVKG
ncbi:MAG: carbohydrate ABC transporter permease [Firmicutes bacterium]|nr:carbohydrate ABC transporter permease [Bacillota bacterium]